MHPYEYGLQKAAYSVSEAMSVLSIGRTSIYLLVKDGKLTPTKMGRKTLFLAADLARLLDELRASFAPKDGAHRTTAREAR
jgi:excisionase family DNA binding protein